MCIRDSICTVTINCFVSKGIERYGRGELLDAVYVLANAEYIPIETALTMTRYLKKEPYFLGIYATLRLRIFCIGFMLKGSPGGFQLFLFCSNFCYWLVQLVEILLLLTPNIHPH